MTEIGLEILRADDFRQLGGRRVGLLVNPASCATDFVHAAELFHRTGNVELAAIFTPQHGLFGHTQANMIEWEGFAHHPEYGCPVFSLYGDHRKPTVEMLEQIDLLIVDLQDIGCRYYTYIWTMVLCMEACAENDREIWVLDRPNPIGGELVEGPVLEMDSRSFVGLYPLPPRHGMTIGEIAEYINTEFYIGASLTVVEMAGWERSMCHGDTGLPWIMPSPNMPTVDTALVYPGQCLLEGTNISEGRGTTKPFELWGAIYLNTGFKLPELPGCHMRPVQFQPTFDKFAGETIPGFQIHVTDRETFKPFRCTIEILAGFVGNEGFQLLPPPYEYEAEKSPLHILIGRGDIFRMLMDGAAYNDMADVWQDSLNQWNEKRKAYLRY